MADLQYDVIVSMDGSPVEDGDYLQTSTDAARVVRHLLAWRGRWLGGGGRVFGCAAWEKLQRAVDTEAVRAETAADFEEALRPLLMEGAVSAVEVTNRLDPGKGRVFRVGWKGRAGDPHDVVLRAPWLLNG